MDSGKFLKRLLPVCVACSLLVVSLTSCSQQEPAPANPAPKAAPATQPNLSGGQAQPNEAPPPPPPGSTVGAPPAAPAAAAPGDGTVQAPADLSQLEHLNWALEMYHVAHIESPPLTSLDPLIKAKLLKEVPKAPPGKKFVLDGPKWEVRLENAK